MTDQQDHAAGDVGAVEAGHGEETRGEQADAGPEVPRGADSRRIMVPDHQLVIFINLDAQEETADQDGGQQENDAAACVCHPEWPTGPAPSSPTSRSDERVEGGQVDGQRVGQRRRRAWASCGSSSGSSSALAPATSSSGEQRRRPYPGLSPLTTTVAGCPRQSLGLPRALSPASVCRMCSTRLVGLAPAELEHDPMGVLQFR